MSSEGDAIFKATSMPDRDWWQALWPDPTRVLEQVGIRSGDEVVDLCSGDGYFTIPMAQLVAPNRLAAVELDPAMLEASKEAALGAEVDNIDFIAGDAMELSSLVPGERDTVLIANTFHGAPDHQALAREVRRVLRPGGSFVIINWWPRPRDETPVLGKPRGPRQELRFSPEQVSSWLEPAGFVLERCEDVGPYHYGLVFRAR